jgi:hypothetical protein
MPDLQRAIPIQSSDSLQDASRRTLKYRVHRAISREMQWQSNPGQTEILDELSSDVRELNASMHEVRDNLDGVRITAQALL